MIATRAQNQRNRNRRCAFSCRKPWDVCGFDPQSSRISDASFQFAAVTDNHYFVVQFDANAQTKADLIVEILAFQGAAIGQLEAALIAAKLMQPSVKLNHAANIAKVRVQRQSRGFKSVC